MSDAPSSALRITIVSSLIQEGFLPAFDKNAFYTGVLGRPYTYTGGLDTDVMTHILAMPIESVTPRLKTLQWDGSDELFLQIFEEWDGHDRVFYVNSLVGIDQCPNLESILFYSGLDTDDLRPLSHLPRLRRLKLFGPKPLGDLRPLLSLGRLERVEIDLVENDVNRAVVKELAARGVRFGT